MNIWMKPVFQSTWSRTELSETGEFPGPIELAQRNLDALEADNASEETQATLAMYIGELYCWQEDGEVIEPEVKVS